jgi:hypothetical protein
MSEESDIDDFLDALANAALALFQAATDPHDQAHQLMFTGMAFAAGHYLMGIATVLPVSEIVDLGQTALARRLENHDEPE